MELWHNFAIYITNTNYKVLLIALILNKDLYATYWLILLVCLRISIESYGTFLLFFMGDSITRETTTTILKQ